MKHKLLIFLTVMTMSSAQAFDKKLPQCKTSPNCVSTQADPLDKQHFIAPFKFIGDPSQAFAAFKKALLEQSRTVITDAGHDEIHAEVTSLVFGFVDDVSAMLDSDAGLIHVRSASRTGHSDFGVNRKRIEALRIKLKKAGAIE